MSDIRVSMREFRFLEEKRKLAPLTEGEEQRRIELGRMLGIFVQQEAVSRGPGRGSEGAGGGALSTASEEAAGGTFSPAPSPAVGGIPQAEELAEVNPDDVMEVDPSDVILVEPGPGGTAAAAAEPQQWVSPPTEHAESPALQTSASAAEAFEPSASSQELAIGQVPAEPNAPVPLTQNFEWVPPSAVPEHSLPLESEDSGVQANEPAVPLQRDEVPAGESSVIDLSESDAMQMEVSPPLAQPRPAGAAVGADVAQSASAIAAEAGMEIEPVAQWANGPDLAPSVFEQQRSGDIAAARHRELGHTPDPSSATEPTPPISAEPAPSSSTAELSQPSAPAPSTAANGATATGAFAAGNGVSSSRPGDNMPEVWKGEAAAPAFPNTPAQFRGQSAPAAPLILKGERRVVLHLLDGQVKRGTIRDFDQVASSVALHSAAGAEDISADRLKAIFFMLAPGSAKAPPVGQKIRLTFQDGREVIGFSADFKTGDPGFFLTPADLKTNTERIFVFRWSIYSVAEE